MKSAVPMNRLLQSLRPALVLILLLCLPVPATAQTPPVEGPGVRTYVVEGETLIEWYARENEIFFLQISDANDHLKRWTWAPVIETGVGDFISYEFGGDTPKGFARLHYTTEVLPEGETLESWDLDGDGLSNFDEVTIHQTNPLKADTDGDGLSDGWEAAHGLDPNDPTGDNGADGDPDGDGSTNVSESQAGTHPQDGNDFPPQIVIATRHGVNSWTGHQGGAGEEEWNYSANWAEQEQTGSGSAASKNPVDVVEELDNDFGFPGESDDKMTVISLTPGQLPSPLHAFVSRYWRVIGSNGFGTAHVDLQDRRVWLRVPPAATEDSAFEMSVLSLHERNFGTLDNHGNLVGDESASTAGVEIKTLRVEQGQTESAPWNIQFLPEGAEGNFSERISSYLLPVEVRDIKDHADTNDDVTITNWDTAQNIADNNIAWIEAHTSDTNAAPRMPQLELRIHGLPQNVMLEAKLLVEYERPYAGKQADDTVRIPEDGSFQNVTNGQWEIWNSYANLPFFGGDAILTYKINGGAEQTITFAIGGRNPDDARCKAYTQNRPSAPWYAYAIEKHESQAYNPGYYNQFWERSGNSTPVNPGGVNYTFTKGDPLVVRSEAAGVGGVGLAQVTGAGGNPTIPDSREVYWNWQKNVDAFLSILAGKIQIAETFMNDPNPRSPTNSMPNGQRPQTAYHTGQDVPVPSRVQGHVTFGDNQGERRPEDAVAIKAYNGAQAHWCSWRGPTVHEWQFNYGQNNYVQRVGQQVEEE